MSQRNTDSVEAERWKRKFLDALEDQEKREKSFNNRIKLLRRGLVGVSLAGDGLDPDLDKELASLRSSLRAEESEAGFEVLFERIEKSVLRLDTRKEQSSEALQSALNTSVAQLQSLDLPRDKKRSIRKYAKSLPSRIRDSQNHPELIVEYLELLKSVVEALSGHQDKVEETEKVGFWRSFLTGGKEAQAENEASQEESVADTPTLTPSPANKAAALDTPALIQRTTIEQGAQDSEHSAEARGERDSNDTGEPEPSDLDLSDLSQKPSSSHESSHSAPVRTQTQSEQAKEGAPNTLVEPESEPGFSAIANHAEPALLRILENIYVSEKSEALARKIKTKVASGLNWYEFVAVLEDISAVITSSLGQEREEFQQFLNELNSSLEQVQEYVKTSRESDGKNRESDQALDEEVRTQVADIAESVRTAENIQELKTSVQGQLENIIESMDSFKAIKQEHHEASDERTQALEERIKVMEKESVELKNSLAQQEENALKDALTGLPNRAAYDKWVKQELPEALNSQPDNAIVSVCDVDHFKNINDTYGHLAGDKVLKILAKEIRKRIREQDFLARYGGEEFVLIMPNTPIEQAAEFMEPIREAIAQCPFHFKEQQVQITMSFGLAEYREGSKIEQVFERADKALYRAKDSGRNRVCLENEPNSDENPSD
ncbi:MAG: diguanylate cyclase [Pseudohongiellaceae bacterium]|nr:diguanylate cyclase [Pseudohongiellaceae bacterium]